MNMHNLLYSTSLLLDAQMRAECMMALMMEQEAGERLRSGDGISSR